jgi:hypothetical protein
MGAGGYGPLQADCCCDLIDLVAIEKIVAKALKSPRKYGDESIRGLCHYVYIVSKAGFYGWEQDEVIAGCITLLQHLLDDDSYICDWDEPAKIRAALRKQISQLRSLVPNEDES